MFACCSAATVRISRSKRSALSPLRQLGREHLHDDLPLEPQFLGDEDAAHAAAAELALEAVGVTEGFLELAPQVGQDTATPCWSVSWLVTATNMVVGEHKREPLASSTLSSSRRPSQALSRAQSSSSSSRCSLLGARAQAHARVFSTHSRNVFDRSITTGYDIPSV